MIYFIIFTFFAGGLFAIFSDVLGLPPIATAKGIKIAVKSRQSIVDSILTVVVMPIVKIVSPFIIIAEYKEKRMAKQLVRAGIPLTPKEYYARSLVVAILSTVIAYVQPEKIKVHLYQKMETILNLSLQYSESAAMKLANILSLKHLSFRIL